MSKKILLLDGAPAGHECLGLPLDTLREVLQETDAVVTTFALRDIRMAHCIGCFGCWVETPGTCVMADAGHEIYSAMQHNDITILFTPVTFGGYSSELKKAIDRRLPLTAPFFCKEQGETRHPPRYAHRSRLIGIGWQSRPDAEEAGIFKMLVGRNAINAHAASFAADVSTGSDPPEMQRERMRALLTREDPLPFGTTVLSIMPEPVSGKGGTERCGAAKRALLIIGSPKVKSPSTSGVLGEYLLEHLRGQGWQTESVTLKAGTLLEDGDAAFLPAVDRADLIILAFPLYIDSLPFLATRALEAIAVHRRSRPLAHEQSLVALCNCGFPEVQHTAPALAICRQFALQCKMTWAGCLTLGAGEALSSGEPLSASGGKGHPPTRHVMRALEITAQALTKGDPVPAQALKLCEKCPIPLLPFSLWCWIFRKLGGRYMRKSAEQHGVSKEEMLKRPCEGPGGGGSPL